MSGAYPSRINVSRRPGVVTVSINNPPVNVLDLQTMAEIRTFLASIRNDKQIKVVIFESANPDFFVAHVDLTLAEQPGLLGEFARSLFKGLNPFQAFSEELRNAPQITIVKLAGLARGGGAEFVAAADMAFAAEGRAGLAQCEALMGIIPGGGGTQYLADRMTRGRALETILGAELLDARDAERYGWINRAIPADGIDAYVDQLASNIASLADGVIAATKKAIPPRKSYRAFWRETMGWFGLVQKPAANRLMKSGLAAGAQTRDGELNLEHLLRSVQKAPSEPQPTPTQS